MTTATAIRLAKLNRQDRREQDAEPRLEWPPKIQCRCGSAREIASCSDRFRCDRLDDNTDAKPKMALCAGCGTYHELRRHAKVWVQMRHKPCSRGLGR